jgi:hypothetical protein
MSEDPHRPLVVASLDLEHLRFLELVEARVREIERNGNGHATVRGEPLV